MAGTDYGGGRPPLPRFLRDRLKNLRLIMRDLPDTAKRDIGYRNAWKLLTGNPWGGAKKTETPPAAVVENKTAASPYGGVISDGHGHFKGKNADPDGTIKAMDRNNIDVVLLWVKSQDGWTDDDTLEFSGKYPGWLCPASPFRILAGPARKRVSTR